MMCKMFGALCTWPTFSNNAAGGAWLRKHLEHDADQLSIIINTN